MPRRTGRGRARVLSGAAALALAAPAAALAQAPGTTPGDALAALNAQRAAHAIPAGLVESPEYSLGCRLHMDYERLNGRSPALPHAEDPARPGYTALGDQAARSSVLGDAAATWAAGNPWENAPIHLMDTLAPGLVQTGWAPGCMWTAGTVPRPAPAGVRVFTYPGPGAPIAPRQIAAERPFVPGDFVGLPAGTLTGPHLLVMPFRRGAPGPTWIAGAALAGPDGPVAVRTVDESTVGPLGDLGGYLEGGMIIPVAPLRPGRDYTAAAELLVAGEAVDVSWTFRTTGGAALMSAPSTARIHPRVRVAATTRTRDRVRVTLLGGEAAGRPARISVRPLGWACRPACRIRVVGPPRTRATTLRARQTLTLPRLPHGVRLVVTTRAFTSPEGVRFAGVRLARTIA